MDFEPCRGGTYGSLGKGAVEHQAGGVPRPVENGSGFMAGNDVSHGLPRLKRIDVPELRRIQLTPSPEVKTLPLDPTAANWPLP